MLYYLLTKKMCIQEIWAATGPKSHRLRELQQNRQTGP